MWKHSLKIHRKRPVNGSKRHFRICVETIWREMRKETCTRKQVSAKEQAQCIATVSGVPHGVTGQMHGAKPPPNLNQVAVINPPVRYKGLISKYFSNETLHAVNESIAISTGRFAQVEIAVRPRRRNPSSVALSKYCRVQNVIKVTVGEDDSSNRKRVPRSFRQFLPKTSSRPNETGINEVQSLKITKDIEGYYK